MGGIFTLILAGFKVITKGITKIYSNSSIIHNLYKVKVEKKEGEPEEDFEISDC